MSDQNPYTARVKEMQDSPRAKSLHQERVESFMFHAGQEVPKTPTIPSEEVRLLRAKLILEEALETIKALGVVIVSYTADTNTDLGLSFDDFEFRTWRLVYNTSTKIYEEIPVTPDIAEVVDGCCDIKVVTTGTLSAFGIADISTQKAVDESNLDKFKIPVCTEGGGPSSCVMYHVGNGVYKCRKSTCGKEKLGPYKAESGKWIKGPDWQPPNWEKILAEQGYMEDEPNLGIGHTPRLVPINDPALGEKFLVPVPVVNEDSVPVGPGDGLRKRDTNDGVYPYTAYQGHQCPDCKAPLSDEAVKRMCLNLTKFSCPECRTSMSACTKSWTRPKVIAVTD